MRVVPQLIRHGRYTRPALGVEVDEGVNARLSRLLGIEGVFVLDVAPGSPAAAAGLTPLRLTPDGRMAAGDIIIAVAGKPVDSVARLHARLDDFAVGDVVQIGLLRGGRRHTVTVTLQSGN